MQVRPLQDRVLVERLEEERKTAGGIIIPDNNTEKPAEGLVVSVGRERFLTMEVTEDLTLKKETKFFSENTPEQKLKLEGKDYLIMREDDILGVIQ